MLEAGLEKAPHVEYGEIKQRVRKEKQILNKPPYQSDRKIEAARVGRWGQSEVRQ